MASITWAVSGGRVVEVVDGVTRVTDISVDDFNAGRLPYGQIVGDPYNNVPHQDSPTNFDVSTQIVPWLEDVYRGDPLPGVQPNAGERIFAETVFDAGPTGSPIPYYRPGQWMPFAVGTPIGGIPQSTPTGVGLDTSTGGPKPLAVIGPRDEFIGGRQGEIRIVGPGPLVGESSGIRMGSLPRIVLRDQLGE